MKVRILFLLVALLFSSGLYGEDRDFEKYMKEGGGMYVYHSANNTFNNWDEYNRMHGTAWRLFAKGCR